jgi:hypothetical protein
MSRVEYAIGDGDRANSVRRLDFRQNVLGNPRNIRVNLQNLPVASGVAAQLQIVIALGRGTLIRGRHSSGDMGWKSDAWSKPRR